MNVNNNEEKKARIWAMLCHLTALLGMTGVPFGHLLGPFIIWMLKKNAYPFVDANGRESLKFQLSMTIYVLIAVLLIFINIGFIILFILVITNAILVIVASTKAYSGETYNYPFKIRFLK